jgi:hypothetical protein
MTRYSPARLPLRTMSQTESASDDVRTHQFKKHQTIAISAQVVPMCRELMVKTDRLAYQADNDDSPDLAEFAEMLQNASDELAELAQLAQARTD